GGVVGRSAEARALSDRIRAGLDEVRAAAGRAPKVPALVVVWSDPLFVVGKDTFTSELLALAGGENVAQDAGVGFPKYSLERVLRRAPGVIVLGSHTDGTPTAEALGYWQRWPTLPAVRAGRVHAVDGDLLFRPGPRLVEGARALLSLFHPPGQGR